MQQLSKNIDDIRKLEVISELIPLSEEKKDIGSLINDFIQIIPKAFSENNHLSLKISFDNKEYLSPGFEESKWIERYKLEIAENKKGAVEIFYRTDFNEKTKENNNSNHIFFSNISHILSGAISRQLLRRLYYDNNERLKELKGINLTTEILRKSTTLNEALQEICNLLPEAWQYPEYTKVRITFEDKVYVGDGFKESTWVQRQSFETPGNKKGVIEVFYLKEFPELYEGPFLKEERNLIDNLAAIISGSVSTKSLKDLLIQNTERLKELRGINQTSQILKQSSSIEDALQIICTILPDAWQYPQHTVARITYEKRIFTSPNFKTTRWGQKQFFETRGNKKGLIEIYYLKQFPKADEGPFLKEERNLLINLANLITGSATKEVLNKLLSENKERLKELKAINLTSRIIAEGKPVEETLQEICDILPKSWQYPRYTTVRISFESNVYTTARFQESQWFQSENFVTIDNKKGSVEVFYTKEFPEIYEGPFLKEERDLLINIGKLISGYLNNYKGRQIFRKNVLQDKQISKPEEYRKSLIKNKQPLQLFFNQQVIDKYIYLDMMKYKVREILFVATLYDAFILENEDKFFEQYMGEIYQYSLFSLPRVTGVTSGMEALELLETTNFDLVVLMVGLDKDAPVKLSKKIKQKKPAIPIYLLLNQKSNVNYFENLVSCTKSLDKLFVWNGDSQILFAMVKSTEDQANVENDTKIGLVRVILLVENSALYYSKYLQILYSIVFGQVKQLLPEVEKNELDKICKMRSRPKILLARNYEDAVQIFNQYKDFLLCVISDVEFEKSGKLDKKAGVKFIRYVKSNILKLPIILQSSEESNQQLAEKLDVLYINKNSESLLGDLKNHVTYYMGFGDFIFRDKSGNQIAVANSLREFEKLIQEIPDESFYLHGVENQFSIWLMARGEIQLAKILNPIRVGGFENIKESRKYITETIINYKKDKKRGKVVSYEEVNLLDEQNIVTFANGSLGGKGRGLAFINTLIYNLDFSAFTKEINIRTPKTVIIGTDEFDYFLDKNKLFKLVIKPHISYKTIRHEFVNAQLSPFLRKKLEFFIKQVEKPIAVRSSSLSEDSFTQPFAGVFDTYIIPNSVENKKLVLEKIEQSIKLVFASIYSDDAKNYFKAINHRVEDEKMAVVLQELVGNQYDKYYYPHISGVASSYNYYPVSHMKAEEGYAVAAIGLGSYVVEGWKAYRFSPKYPKLEMYTNKDLINSSQLKFFAVDCTRTDIDYEKEGELAALSFLDISEAEEHGVLKHCASVYNPSNDIIEPGLRSAGPRIINFANILKYDYIPLASTIEVMLNTIKEAFGSPVEIEYAVDLSKTWNGLPSFYLLQIKPLVENQPGNDINLDEVDTDKILLYTQSSLGNGKIKDIVDIIYVDTEKFDKLKTREMAKEIEQLNHKMVKQHKNYILIGPGRWGTRDQFLGIPVIWSQISNAKIIVEISLENFPLDSSLGSHFFHNVTSMNIGYFSILDSSPTDFIRWDKFAACEIVDETKYFKHIKFNKSLEIYMNGKEHTSLIIGKE